MIYTLKSSIAVGNIIISSYIFFLNYEYNTVCRIENVYVEHDAYVLRMTHEWSGRGSITRTYAMRVHAMQVQLHCSRCSQCTERGR